MGLAGMLALLATAPAWCGDSYRGPLGKPARFLSKHEAITLALDNMAPRCEVRWLGLDGTTGPASGQLRTAVRLNHLLLNVETAYWNLYGAYWKLHSREQGLRQAQDAWCLVCSRYLMGKCGAADVAQIEGQYELFRAQRLQAIDHLLDDERQLRELLGMRVGDGTRLVPSDTPVIEKVDLRVPCRFLIEPYQQVKAQRAQHETFAKQVRQRSQDFQAGRGMIDTLLEAQRFLADAVANECEAIVAYNNALAAFEDLKAGDEWGQEVSEERETCDPSFALPDVWEKAPPLKEVGPLPQIRELKQGQGLTEQDVDEILPPPREIPLAPKK
jgi:hypothetical protein